jgi:cyclase
MASSNKLPVSSYFRLQQLAAGVYFALETPTHGAGANAGIIDLGDRLLLFDTFAAVEAAAELRAAAEALAGRPVTTVINSHAHVAHTQGNSLFAANVDIVSTHQTRQLLAATATRLPNVTFEKNLALHGPQRSVEVISYGGGHTQSDAMLWLPQERIVFMGDLLTVGHHPHLGDGDPGEVNRTLDMVRGLQPAHLLPGHGAAGTVADLESMGNYINTLAELALTELTYRLDSTADLEATIAHIPVPHAFAIWARPGLFRTNLRFLHQRLIAAYAD